MPQSNTYGTWNSPVSAEMLSGTMRLYDVQWSDDGETLLWVERRPSGGTLVAQRGRDAFYDLTDSRYSVSGRVGYGGGEFTTRGDTVYFISDGRVHRVALAGGQARAITPNFGGAASPAVSADGRWLAFVHTDEGRDVIALVDTEGQHWPQKLATGDDFVMQPVWHPDGTHLAYVAWNHPQMPWNGSELRLMTLTDITAGLPQMAHETTLAGDTETAVFQPIFSPNGKTLAYVSDADGYGHIYLHDLATDETRQLTSGAVEHMTPAWVQGMRTIAWSADSQRMYATRSEKAFYSLWRYDVNSGNGEQIDTFDDYTHLSQLSVSPQGQAAVMGSAAMIPPRVLSDTPDDTLRIWRRAAVESLDASQLADVQAITWAGHDGHDVHGLYYPPHHPDNTADGAAPLIVMPHSGPTSQQPAEYEDEAQFFATRGYGVLYVNYRGSTGYGKEYMNKHAGNWGVYDVQDCITGAQYLVDEGEADGDKLVIMGSSAGGFTVLQALVDKPGFFKAGIVSYGVSDQFALVRDTHKFEARYSEWLLGALPKAADIYRERSPLLHAERIADPLLVFQGGNDKVVPKSQADDLVKALRRSGTPHEYKIYEDEGHGFRQPETIKDFYQRVENFLLDYVIYA